MHLLNTLQILHENPYTGDKISKACVVYVDPALLSTDSKCVQDDREEEQQTHAGATAATISDNSSALSTGSIGAEGPPQSLPKLLAIKYLSDYRTVRTRRDTSQRSGAWNSQSSDSESESESESESSLGDSSSIENPTRRLSDGMAVIGETNIPQGIKFGVKAKREIRALRAAQGHPNVVPFLGFTGLPKKNPFKQPKKQQDELAQTLESYQANLLALPTPKLSQSGSLLDRQDSTSNGDSISVTTAVNNNTQPQSGDPLGGELLGRSLFQDCSPAPQDLFPPFHNSGFNSDYESDATSSDDDGADEDSPAATARAWNRLFTRQPRMGGILLPYIPITVLDLIQIGWTRTRPLLVEVCMRQILEGLAWIHDEAGLIHRDISAGNIMVSIGQQYVKTRDQDQEDTEDGAGKRSGVIQCMISDFGCATFVDPAGPEKAKESRETSTAMSESQTFEDEQLRGPRLTFEVGTRAYRAPELLFSSVDYSSSIDIWSAGVLFAEMFLGSTLFEADSDIGQICAIVKVLGTPTSENWPEYTSMPDHGKLQFRALETNPLSSILLSKPTTAAFSSDGELAEASDITKASTKSATFISQTAFELIDRMIVYSGSARPSARTVLALSNQYLERTKYLESNIDNQQQDPLHQEFLDQCIIDEREILDEKERLRAQKAEDEDEYGGYQGGFLFGGAGPWQRSGRADHSEGEEESELEEAGYRSDDLTGEGEGRPGSGPVRLGPGFGNEYAYGYGMLEDDGEEASGTTNARAVKRHRDVDNEDDDGGEPIEEGGSSETRQQE